MGKLFIFNILVLFLYLNSCSTEKPKNLIVGKWESTTNPRLTLNFDEETYLQGEISSYNGLVYKYNRRYFVVDERNIFLIDNSVGQEVTIEAKINNEIMNFRCFYKRPPNQPNIVDFPELCNYREFIKIK